MPDLELLILKSNANIEGAIVSECPTSDFNSHLDVSATGKGMRCVYHHKNDYLEIRDARDYRSLTKGSDC